MICNNCNMETTDDASFCGSCGVNLKLAIAAHQNIEVDPPAEESSKTKATEYGEADSMHLITESLTPLKTKIDRKTAHLGILIGFVVFGFSLFLPWASIPAGSLASDSGTRSGWSELAFLAFLPLGFALYPVFQNRAVELKNLLINLLIAFALLGYNNVINRATWENAFGNMGSEMGAGFWIGLLAMLAISVCGITWALHTANNQESSD